MELDKILSDAKSLQSYQSGPTLSELQSLNKPSSPPSTATTTNNFNDNHPNDTAPTPDDEQLKPNVPVFKLQELSHLFKRLNIFINKKSSIYCKHLLSILQRTLKMDLAFITEHNINSFLFQPGTTFATTRSINFTSNLQSSNSYFQSAVVESFLAQNIHAILTVPVRLETGKMGSLVAIHQSIYPVPELTKKQQLVVLDLANAVEDVLQVRPKEDWHEARSHLSLCFGLMSCLKPLLHEMTTVESHMNSVWKEVIQLMTIKAMSNFFLKENNNHDATALPRDPISGMIQIVTGTGTIVMVEEKRKLIQQSLDVHNANEILDSKTSLPANNKARRYSGGSGLVSRLRPVMRRTSVDGNTSGGNGNGNGNEVATIRQIALSYFTGDGHVHHNPARVLAGGNTVEEQEIEEEHMSPLLRSISKQGPNLSPNQHQQPSPVVPVPVPVPYHLAAVHPLPSTNQIVPVVTAITSAAASFQVIAHTQGVFTPTQLTIPDNNNTCTTPYSPPPPHHHTSESRVFVPYHAFIDPNYHDDLIVGQLAQLQLHLLSFQDTLLSMIESVERTITVAKGYLLTDRKKYIQSCSEFMTVGLVSKVNAILSRMAQKVLKNSLLWTFKVDSSLAHCCHRTFYHHLILFLENIIYYWAQYSTTTQLLIGFEPVERNMLTKHPYYVSTVEGFIKVLMRFPDRIDGTSSVTPTSSKTPIYRKAFSPAHANRVNTANTSTKKAEEGGEIGQLSFRHATPYATTNTNNTNTNATNTNTNTAAEENSTSTNTTSSTNNDVKGGGCGGGDTAAISPPAEESFHPVRHIHQLLSLLNSSLCRLNQSSTAATVNVRSDSCRISSQEAYFIRIPCMLYLTKAQDHAFLMNHGYRYVDNRNHVTTSGSGGAGHGTNGGPVAGMPGTSGRAPGSSRYLPNPNTNTTSPTASSNSNNPAHNIPVKGGIILPRWLYMPLKSCFPFLTNHIRIHATATNTTTSTGSGKEGGKRKSRRREGTVRRPSADGSGGVRRSSKNITQTASVRPYPAPVGGVGGVGGAEEEDDNGSVSSHGSHNSHNSHNSQGSRNSQQNQQNGGNKSPPRKKSFGSTITPI